jgi:hypothetical protein
MVAMRDPSERLKLKDFIGAAKGFEPSTPTLAKGCAPGGKSRSRPESTLASPKARHNGTLSGEYLVSFEFN